MKVFLVLLFIVSSVLCCEELSKEKQVKIDAIVKEVQPLQMQLGGVQYNLNLLEKTKADLIKQIDEKLFKIEQIKEGKKVK